ncbi:MAG: hypothetical protein K0R92_1620 [Lachnospiraceae bacterium]|jgi:predicted nucleotidyltransferase|nr:hypothetical protein [Lachnospiraceae bacterium]
MKVVGLITEYNPFHNGHLYHINEAKRITGADYVVVVMSGNFVQRGAPAFMDKYSRTRMALACGADIVFELPVCYSTSSAEFFALGAVSLLERLGIIDELCFGSECGDIDLLSSIAKILLDEPDEYKNKLNALLKEGKTFPNARMEAIKSAISDIHDTILSSPNNILGIEYLKALFYLKSSIKPITIKRVTAGYHDAALSFSSGNTISSATAIRKVLRKDETLNALEHHVPSQVFDILKNNYNKTFPIQDNDFTLLLQYKMLNASYETLTSYTDITSDLAHRLLDIPPLGQSFQQYALQIKSRQWTLTRINRVLIHILLDLKADNFNLYNNAGYTQYARLLGFQKSSSHLLRSINHNGVIPVITKLADAKSKLSKPGNIMLQEDITAARLYHHLIFNKFNSVLKDEFTRGVIILE